MQPSRGWKILGAALCAMLTWFFAPKSHADSVPQRPKEKVEVTASSAAVGGRVTQAPVFALDAGLAGPPIVSGNGSWWVLGRDGQLVNLAANDTLVWAIGVGAAITGAATTGDNELLFVPTASDLIVAIEPGGTTRWRSRTARGVDGPLAWVTGQGLVFVGHDQNVYWLGPNAALLQTQRLGSRRSAGPVALGSAFAIGTETGEFLVWSNRNLPARFKLPQPIHSVIAAAPSEFLVLAGNDAYGVSMRGQVRWQRAGVAALGYADTPAASEIMNVVVTQTGRVEWLNSQAEGARAMEGCTNANGELVAELVATRECAWVSTNSGTLLQCCVRSGVRRFDFASMPLLRPVVDMPHHRVLVGSSEREVWSVPLLGGNGDD